jgi:hypothetical protein
MLSLTITDAAFAKIQKELSSTEIESPVISLVQSSQSLPPQDEVLRAVVSGASESVLRGLALDQYRANASSIRWALIPGVYRREDVPPECLIQVRGIWFSFSPEWRATMDGWLLEASDEGLVLKDGAGNVVLPHPFDIGALDDA